MSDVIISPELLARYNKPGPRYTSYPTVPAWTGTFGEAEYREALADVAARPDDALSVYVHLPFCAEHCAYCGCNATVTRRSDVVDRYLDRIERELSMVTPLLGGRRQVVQLHWGGGTPNFLSEAQMMRLVNLLSDNFAIDWAGEISLEIDPRIGTVEQLAQIHAMGFNRISLGVQDINVDVQAAIGRIQPFEQTEKLYRACRDLGFASVNLDLVYGLPLQTQDGFHNTLKAIGELRPDRIACFSYAHVPWVKPQQKAIDATKLPDTYTKFSMFRMAIDTLAETGYDWVGMDHFALREDELAVAARELHLHRNFMGYTTRPAPHMLAFGMSSIGELAGRFAQNEPHLGRYQKMVDAGQLPVVKGYKLSDDDLLRRTAILHLMCNLELPYDLTRAAFGVDLRDALGDDLDRLEAYVEDGFVELLPDRVQVTPLGRFFVRNLAMELDAHLAKTAERTVFSKTV
ncbi:oxygen-independent coproporphyrinogen III oxidase [Oscillochloris sp. ZM17-4]|uniref:oxygen-independent coproporphyrinogen III oxidase n=1 Tax=Oscillochloris sp. ZM17-4 TaxID=2866714 RepID=UPI001C736809|nr:oxygen-independent coproporphyrinogen III oxidase [Oscillochloris sp. ZM17-4]MBX0328061.1 oxygen-independent coproporphyrinogen III oxidase [Oscillochloris sp. ZM17-4]